MTAIDDAVVSPEEVPLLHLRLHPTQQHHVSWRDFLLLLVTLCQDDGNTLFSINSTAATRFMRHTGRYLYVGISVCALLPAWMGS